MPRAKGGPKTRRRHKKTMKLAKGYVGGRRKTYRQARETVERGLTYAYRDRKVRKREFRSLWIVRINAACARQRALVQPADRGAEGGRGRGRPQDPRGARAGRPARLRRDRRRSRETNAATAVAARLRAELAGLREAALAEIAGLPAVRPSWRPSASATSARRVAERDPARPRRQPPRGAPGHRRARQRGEGRARRRSSTRAARRSAAERARARRSPRTASTSRCPARGRPRGHVHPLRAVEDEIVDIFVAMGFRVAEGPEIEDDFHNFEALNFPPDHPARDTQDTLFVDAGGDRLLRTHTSPVQIRVMRRPKPPLRVVAPGTVYRRDELDPTHSPMFQQIEGFMVDEHVTFADLKGVLSHFLAPALRPSDRACASGRRSSRSPSRAREVDIACIACGGGGRARSRRAASARAAAGSRSSAPG